jgi:hypothetical protein
VAVVFRLEQAGIELVSFIRAKTNSRLDFAAPIITFSGC